MTSDLTSKMTRKATVESVPPSRTMQETFEYLRDHLHVELASPARGTVAVRLMITNPATRELEVLDEDRVEIGLTEL